MLLTEPWAHITAAARRSKAFVAVAYLGKGARSMLPLKAGSILVVDASPGAVKAGQTYPKELMKYVRRRVDVYSQKHLHAKVFGFADRVFVGSTNASKHSRDDLVEAAVQLTTTSAVAEARDFVKELAIKPIGLEYLKELQKQYRPPHFPAGNRRTRKRKAPRLIRLLGAEPLRVINVVPIIFDEAEERAAAKARAAAKRNKTPGWRTEEIAWVGWRKTEQGEQVLQVVQEGGAVWLEPPGNVLSAMPVRGKRKEVVVIEMPPRRRTRLAAARRKLPAQTRKRIQRNGRLNQFHAAAVRALWQP
jgi:hypothetical protein